ncbi:MAG: hypothetical protein KKB81_03505 [Candidatus Margulisbacteria bacterium]|nr:hypothetical protein [Candidatus Margulisiibacteriota bacterium]MBU1729602.1 hypothetical protein [Candidatus Margulisiibacteriota bacterium]MBU1956027.1 hypothetical protein [Candidatus Margulisiibacteriota bacterium]
MEKLINTKHKGDQGVAQVLSNLLSEGFQVSIPWGDLSPYDLILDTGKLLRIQVKYTSRRKNGALIIKVGSITSKNGKPTLRPHGLDPIDFIIAYDSIGRDFYILPQEIWKNIKCGQIYLRIEPSKNKQQKNIHDATHYKNAWHLVR